MTSALPETTRFTAYYRPTAATNFATRAWVSTVLWAAITAGVFYVLYVPLELGLPLSILLGVVVLIASLVSLHAALRAREKWSADNGLAIAVGDDGVTLPRVGLVPWERISGVRIVDIGITMGNVYIAAFQFWNGTRDNAYLAVFLTDEVNTLSEWPPITHRRITLGGPKGKLGFRSAFRQGMGDAEFAEAARVLTEAATARGIPIIP